MPSSSACGSMDKAPAGLKIVSIRADLWPCSSISISVRCREARLASSSWESLARRRCRARFWRRLPKRGARLSATRPHTHRPWRFEVGCSAEFYSRSPPSGGCAHSAGWHKWASTARWRGSWCTAGPSARAYPCLASGCSSHSNRDARTDVVEPIITTLGLPGAGTTGGAHRALTLRSSYRSFPGRTDSLIHLSFHARSSILNRQSPRSRATTAGGPAPGALARCGPG
jgi:hypothetical protein